MHTLDTNIINKYLPELLSYKHLYLLYMSCNTFYTDKLSEEELEQIYYTPKTNDDLKESVEDWYYYERNNKKNPLQDISRWNTKHITSMKNLFYMQKKFNKNIEDWIIGNVTDMRCMFYGAHEFNQPLDKWNVSNVTTMNNMFENCIEFNQPLNCWNVSN